MPAAASSWQVSGGRLSLRSASKTVARTVVLFVGGTSTTVKLTVWLMVWPGTRGPKRAGVARSVQLSTPEATTSGV